MTDSKSTKNEITYCKNCNTQPVLTNNAPLCFRCYFKLKYALGWGHPDVKQTIEAIYCSYDSVYYGRDSDSPKTLNPEESKNKSNATGDKKPNDKCEDSNNKCEDYSKPEIKCTICMKESRISESIPVCVKCNKEAVEAFMKSCRICQKDKAISAEISACKNCVKNLIKKSETQSCAYCGNQVNSKFKYCIYCLADIYGAYFGKY